MLAILNVVAPVFALVATGFLAVRYKLYPTSGVAGLIAFVNNFATPCLLFRAMLSVDFEAAFNPSLLGPFYIGAIFIFVAGIVIARAFFKSTPGEAVSVAFAGTFTNTVLLGIPIVQRAYGDDASPVIFSIIGVHVPILFTIAMLTMEMSRREGAPLSSAIKRGAKSLVTSPLLLGVVFGLLGNLVGLTLIEPVDAFTRMMAQAVLPAALFGLGGALNAYRIRDNWEPAVTMSLFKLFLHPAIAWVVLVPILKVDPEIARYVVLLAAMPSGINVYVFATNYNRAVDVAANTILITTMGSVFSVSLWLFLLRL